LSGGKCDSVDASAIESIPILKNQAFKYVPIQKSPLPHLVKNPSWHCILEESFQDCSAGWLMFFPWGVWMLAAVLYKVLDGCC